MKENATIGVTLKPENLDPKGTWQSIWNMANEVAKVRGKNCMEKSNKIMEKATQVRDVTTNWAPDDSAENDLQNKVTALYSIYEHFNDMIQNQNVDGITQEDWIELETFLIYTKTPENAE